MNKIFKIVVSILAGTNIIFNIFSPLALVLLLIVNVDMNWFSENMLIIAGLFSSLYKAIDSAGINTIEYLLKETIKKSNIK